MSYLSEGKNGEVVLRVYVQPKASRDQLAGLHGDALKLCISAPPVDGRANIAVLQFLGRLLGLPKSSLSIKSGHQGRTKRLVIKGLGFSEAQALLAARLSSSQ